MANPTTDRRSAEALVYRRWYGSNRWRRQARAQLIAEPFCCMCLADRDAYVIAKVADHVVPHRGDPVSFWTGKLQSLCAPHHNSAKQREERHPDRVSVGVDADGWPLGR